MDLLIAIMNLGPAHLFVGAAAVFVLIRMAGESLPSVEEDDDYENASWNPASVNYND
jgi:hypothetical protein